MAYWLTTQCEFNFLLADKLRDSTHSLVERTEPKGSGRYPYGRLRLKLRALLQTHLARGPVVLVAYSFSCRAVSLLWLPDGLVDEFAPALLRNLRAVVMLSPPKRW